jgi:hypothetical protein
MSPGGGYRSIRRGIRDLAHYSKGMLALGVVAILYDIPILNGDESSTFKFLAKQINLHQNSILSPHCEHCLSSSF